MFIRGGFKDISLLKRMQLLVMTITLGLISDLMLSSPSIAQEAPAPFQIRPYVENKQQTKFYSVLQGGFGDTMHTAELPRGPAIDSPMPNSPYISQRVVGDVDGSWIIVRFNHFNLGEKSSLRITSLQDPEQIQNFNQEVLTKWEGESAMFPGGLVKLELSVSPSDKDVSYDIKDFLLGEFLERKEGDKPESFQQDATPEPEAICGVDDRTASTDHRLGRIMPVGCTGWAISNGAFLSAGHCVQTNRMRLIEFEVPKSQPDGTPVPASVNNQYRIVQESIESNNGGIGDDWAVFSVVPNASGQIPQNRYGSFDIVQEKENANVSVRGYGLDDEPTGSPPRLLNSDSQTQQQHVGELVALNVNNNNNAVIKHRVDTRGGNSGSPIFFIDGSGKALGIHSHGGCNNSRSSANHGTSFKHKKLWSAIQRKGPL